MKKSYNNNEGYTLIEVAIALVVAAIVFVEVYSLFATSLRNNTESRYEIVAGELVQEGIEIIKNKKEQNELKWAIWNPQSDDPEPQLNDGLPDEDFNPMVDFSNESFDFYTGNFDLQYDLSEGEYVLKTNCSKCVGPVFTRTCNQSLDHLGDNLRVSCTVSWPSLLLKKGENRSVEAETILTDWER